MQNEDGGGLMDGWSNHRAAMADGRPPYSQPWSSTGFLTAHGPLDHYSCYIVHSADLTHSGLFWKQVNLDNLCVESFMYSTELGIDQEITTSLFVLLRLQQLIQTRTGFIPSIQPNSTKPLLRLVIVVVIDVIV
jgi:hypothetical protein